MRTYLSTEGEKRAILWRNSPVEVSASLSDACISSSAEAQLDYTIHPGKSAIYLPENDKLLRFVAKEGSTWTPMHLLSIERFQRSAPTVLLMTYQDYPQRKPTRVACSAISFKTAPQIIFCPIEIVPLFLRLNAKIYT